MNPPINADQYVSRSAETRLTFQPTQLTLGAVQLGLSYGVANATGLPSEGDARAILDAAVAGGINVVDTARAYGESEERIGQWMASRSISNVKVVTKIPAVPATNRLAREQFVAASLAASSRALGQSRLDLVLAHQARDLLDDAVISALEKAMRDGLIAGFGASVYEPEEAALLVRHVPIQAIQAPISLVDRRMPEAGLLDDAHAAGIAVFARSVFLQGVLLMPPGSLPAHLTPLTDAIISFKRLASDLGMSLHALALAGVRDLHGVTSVLVGTERVEQMQPHLAAMATPALQTNVMEEIAHIAKGLPLEVINPSLWPRVERPGPGG